MQGGSADIWKENVIEDLEREFLADLKKEFKEGENKIMKVVELKKVEQRSKTMEEFVQKLRRVVRESGYKER